MSQFGTPLASGLIFGPPNLMMNTTMNAFHVGAIFFYNCLVTPFLVPYQINNQGISSLNVVFQIVHLLPIPLSSY